MRRASGSSHDVRAVLGEPRHPAQHRHQQHVGVRQARRRIAGHAEHGPSRRSGRTPWACPASRRCRETRPRRAVQSTSMIRSRSPTELPPENTDDVLRRRRADGCGQILRACRARSGRRTGDAAVRRDDRREREAIDVVDLSRAERLIQARRSRCRSRGSRCAGDRRRRPR